jgi:hypothetical protein
MLDALFAGMRAFDRATLRNIVIAVPLCTALAIGATYLGLEAMRPAASAEATQSTPTGTTTITSAQPPRAIDSPQTPTAAPRTHPPMPAPTPIETKRPTAPPASPRPESLPRDVTKMPPGSLNLPGSGDFTPAPYVPPPPDWVPPPGWTFVPPQPLNLDAGAADRARHGE